MSTSSSSAKKSLVLPLSKDFASRIATWFRKSARELPWRETSDPYKIWVSEVMLQQTTVAAVIDYYKRFLNRFPTLKDLAEADEFEVLKLWQGLGYYRRAKNLRLGAQLILKEFAGKFPKTREDLLKVPGIGAYSAGAILSIAHRVPEAALDGNLIRVYSRLYGITEPVDRPDVIKKLWEIARLHIPFDPEIIREFTEGMMELGATVCLPANARCLFCPVRDLCTAFKNSDQNLIPIKEKKISRLKFREKVFLKFKGEKIAVLRRGSDKKFGDFHRLPFILLTSGDALAGSYKKYKYTVTNRDFEVFVDDGKEKLPQYWGKKNSDIQWIEKSRIKDLLFPTIDRKILKSIPSIFE